MKRINQYAILLLSALAFACNTEEKKDNGSEGTELKVPENTELKTSFKNESIYQLDGSWLDQDSNEFRLEDLEGKIPIVAMVFTSCAYACPRMVADIQNIEKQVPADKQKEMRYVLISFDTERDTPDKLSDFAEEMELDEQWILLNGNESDVREISMLLGVSYKKMPDGNFGHSNQITLLNRKGEIVEQVEGLGSDPSNIVEKIKEL